ncbi:MAG: trigger factor [Sedimentisphaerales bacterium]|nr:trigger factor [Sedimentisphaerales bacterium]
MAEEQKVQEQEDKKQGLPNKVTVTDAGPCRKKVVIEIPAETIRKSTDEQYNELRRNSIVPGFRKGRAPRRLLEKRFGKEASEQIKLKLLAEASDSAIEENKLNILGEPDVDYEKIELGEDAPLKFEFEVEVRPEFELPALEGINVERPKLEITDEQEDSEIERICKWSGLWAPRKEDETIELDDQIIADVILKVEGVEEEQRHDNVEMYARPSGFVGPVPVDKLDELLIGAKAGEDKETSVDIPETFFREEYRGKKVDVKIEIRDVKYLKPAELNETFLNGLGVESEEKLRENVRQNLQARSERQIRIGMVEQVYKYMQDNTKLELPTNVVANYSANLLRRQYANLVSRGLPKEQIAERMDHLKAGSDQQAKEQLKIYFIMDKVAEKLKVEVTDEELNGQIAQLAVQQGQRPEAMRQQMERSGSLEQFRQQIRDEKCVDKILESAKIAEVEPKKSAKKSTKEKSKKTAKSGKSEDKNEKTAKKTAKKSSSDKTTKKPKKKTTKKETDK